MNLYQRIVEGLSGASKAFLNTHRSIKKIDMGDENYLNKFKGKVSKMERQKKAIPQKRARRKARSTVAHQQAKFSLSRDRLRKRHGMDIEGKDE